MGQFKKSWGTVATLVVLCVGGAASAHLPELSLNAIEPFQFACTQHLLQSAPRFPLADLPEAIQVPEFPGLLFYRLGKGNSGTAYLVLKDGVFAGYLKGYKTFKKGWNRDTGWEQIVSAATLRDDDAFLLATYYADQQAGHDWGFKIPETYSIQVESGVATEVLPEEVGIFYRAPFRGRDVLRLSFDPNLSDEFKAQQKADYIRRMQLFTGRMQAISKQFTPRPGEYAEFNGLPNFHASCKFHNGRDFHPLLKPDGIIYDAYSSEMFLVDPN